MRPKEIHIEPRWANTAMRIIEATEQQAKAQTWICSNCGLKRTFHRTSRIHRCPRPEGSRLPGWQGIWRKVSLHNYPRTMLLLPDTATQETDYLIRFRLTHLSIRIQEPQPFSA